ncbi:GGDEF domain-containing protein [uncultured Tyzzerella sp.]|uniref:GGDEF domain-containing protein n=1 Tax=uncultured Tyzzerella sp. TaxID=2321398 RepID=UPI0029425C53|nr:GGDEF domain-containing protein [uncultured Tyzzerella sp.]
MLKIICFLLFVIYSYTALLYSSKLFLNNIKRPRCIYTSTILNFIIVGIILKFEIIVYEWVFMVVYFILMCIQLKRIYNAEWVKNVFITLYFVINFFSVRLIYICIYSILKNTPIYMIVEDFNAITIVTILSFITVIIYMLLFLFFIPIKYIHMIVTDKENLKFAIGILISIYTFIIINTGNIHIEKNPMFIHILYIKSAVCAIIGFFTTSIYCYLFSKLQLYVVKAENIEKEIQQEEIVLKQLEYEANHDYFTSCLKRDVIYKKIDDILSGVPFFCIAFIDIDGLKTTNDVYGHDEGDFYIKAVADILNSEFIGKAIGRIGGDEFLVVLEHTDIYATMKCVIRCFERAENISKAFDKPYSTSISYGVVEITPDNNLSRDEIIKLADMQMYNFKKARKKNRK